MVLDSEVFSLTPVPGKPGEIWASTCGWVYRTQDGGAKWERFKEGFDERRATSFAALPGGRLLAGTVAGLHVSDDGGKTWHRVGDPGISVQSIAFHPAHPERVILGTEGSGVWISEDGGTTVRPSSAGMINTRVSAFAQVGSELMVAVSHAGPLSGVYSSRDGGRTFGDFVALPTMFDIAVHQGRVFAATEKGLFERRGAGWHWVRDLGEGTVEQFVKDGQRLLARTPDGLFELKGKLFTRRPYKHGAPRSATFYGDALWVSDAQGVYRLTADANHTIPAPFEGGRLQPVAGSSSSGAPAGCSPAAARAAGGARRRLDRAGPRALAAAAHRRRAPSRLDGERRRRPSLRPPDPQVPGRGRAGARPRHLRRPGRRRPTADRHLRLRRAGADAGPRGSGSGEETPVGRLCGAAPWHLALIA